MSPTTLGTTFLIAFGLVCVASIALYIFVFRKFIQGPKGTSRGLKQEVNDTIEKIVLPHMDMRLGRRKMPTSIAALSAIGLSLFSITFATYAIQSYAPGSPLSLEVVSVGIALFASTVVAIVVLIRNIRNKFPHDS